LILENSGAASQAKLTVEEQAERSKQVLESLKQIQATTDKAKREAENIKSETDASRRVSAHLAEASELTQGLVGEAVKSTEQVFASSQLAHESVEENGKALDALDQAIQRFTVRDSSD
jgi:methyl-accepting chemotaxis protein